MIDIVKYYLDNEERLWKESDVDEGEQLVERVGPEGDVLPFWVLDDEFGPLTVLVEVATE